MLHVVDMKNTETGDFIGFAVFDTDKDEIVTPIYPLVDVAIAAREGLLTSEV